MENILTALTRCVRVLEAHEKQLDNDEMEVLIAAKHTLKVCDGLCYANIHLLDDSIKQIISEDIRDDNDLMFIPKVDFSHKFVLLEKSYDEHGLEYYSNAFTSGSLDELQRLSERYRAWYNYVTKEAVQFNGKKIKIK